MTVHVLDFDDSLVWTCTCGASGIATDPHAHIPPGHPRRHRWARRTG